MAALAAGQWGVVSRAQLQTLGLSSAVVDTWIRRGRLHRVYRGVYAVGHAALGAKARLLAAVLACGAGAVLSHVSAAVHRGLLHSDALRVDVTAPATRRGAPGIRLHRSRSLDARNKDVHQGIPVTTVARTLLDLAATVTPERLERAVAQAVKLRLYDHRAITDVIARSNGHRGRAALAAAIAHDPKWTRSDLEARFLSLVRTAGLDEPLVNRTLDAPDHGHCEVDFYWPSHCLIVETDGWETHGTRSAFETDRARDAALTVSGYIVMRFTWREIRDRPHTVIARLRAYIRASASRNASSSGSSIE